MAAIRPLVGRRAELAELRRGIDSGRPAFFLLEGEPGIGKTRLAEEATLLVQSQGGATHWGRCWAGDAPAYWPWVQVLRTLEDDVPTDVVDRLGQAAATLAPLVPWMGRAGPPTAGADGPDARFAVYDAVARVLGAVAGRGLVLVVLDDLHWADVSSVELLSFVARTVRSGRLVVVGTARARDLGARPEIAHAVAAAAREGTTLRLSGLGHEDVAELWSLASLPTSDRMLQRVVDATAGNPFFVDEILRALSLAPGTIASAEAGGALPATTGIVDSIRTRLDGLSGAARDLLAVASVAGIEFDLRLFSGLASGGAQELSEAASAAIVEPVASRPGSFRFVHALVRDAVYEGVAAGDRRRLHEAIAETFVRAAHADDARRVFDVAHHFTMAASNGGPAGPAVEWLCRAGRRAAALVAHGEAAHFFERALALGEELGAAERCDLLIQLGEARLRAGAREASREVLARAADAASALGDGTRLGRATASFAAGTIGDTPDEEGVRMLERALAEVGPEDPGLVVHLLASLVELLVNLAPRDVGRRRELSQRAVTLAAAVPEGARARAMAHALRARHLALLPADDTTERLGVAEDLVAVSLELGDDHLVVRNMGLRALDNLVAGRVLRAEDDFEHVRRLVPKLGQPVLSAGAMLFDGLRATMDGRLGDAESAAHEAMRLASHAPDAITATALTTLYAVRMEQCRLQELEAPLRSLVGRHPIVRFGLARLLFEVGRLDEARADVDLVARDGFAVLGRETNGWVPGLALIAPICAERGDATLCAWLYEELEPFGGRVGLLFGAMCLGSIAGPLAVLAAAARRAADARTQAARALEQDARLGRLVLARTRAELALALASADPGFARPLAEEALRAGRELGLARVVVWAEAALERSGGASAPAGGENRLIREGEFWTVVFAGRTSRVRDAKGVHLLARLLEAPGREHHVLDLAAPGGVLLSEVGPALDEQAKDRYRRRLSAIEDELDEARAFDDSVRAEALEQELDALVGQLAGAVGLGGRDRHSGSASERARFSVTRAIRSAMRRISAADPALGRHLDVCVRTGTYCAYTPDPSGAVRWRVGR